MKPLRVLIVDDHAIVREGLLALLAREGDLEVVGLARDGAEARTLAEAHRPDVVLLDVGLPGETGFEVARALIAASPGLAVVMLSMHAESAYVRRALDAGARGYVVKGAGVGEVVAAVRTVAAGVTYLSAGVERPVEAHGTPLSPRERDVVRGIVAGKTTKQIAAELGLSPRTVDHHRERISFKTGARDVATLVRWALDNGFDR